jgi:crotonobetainyl-CoA:carnitine CoA-transferase CaiB-like acyl-CoA transferase
VLCDWGADVVKVERPGGDTLRGIFPYVTQKLGWSPTFELDNRGKRSVALDISKPTGKEVLTKLVRTADVFVTNVRKASLAKAGLDYAALRAVNPRLVYAMVTGYGLDGPDAGKPGYDVTAFWARSGVGAMMIPENVDPFMLRSGMGDHTTALATLSAILCALYERERTGTGRLVYTSLLATGVYTMSSDLAIQLTYGDLPPNRTRENPRNPHGNFFKTRDGRWLVIQVGARDWPTLCRITNRPALLEDARFSTDQQRRANAQPLTAELDAGFAELKFEDLVQRLDEADIAWAPVQGPAEVVADPQVAAAGAWVEVQNKLGSNYLSPAAPAQFPGLRASPRPPAPNVGEHSREILGELGYDAASIDELFRVGAVA